MNFKHIFDKENLKKKSIKNHLKKLVLIQNCLPLKIVSFFSKSVKSIEVSVSLQIITAAVAEVVTQVLVSPS